MYVSSCGSHCWAACPWGEAAPLWRGRACFLSRACLYLDAHQFSDDLSYECFIQEPKYELVWGERPWERKGKVESCMPTRSSEEERSRRKNTSQSTDTYLDLGFLQSAYDCLSLSHLLIIWPSHFVPSTQTRVQKDTQTPQKRERWAGTHCVGSAEDWKSTRDWKKAVCHSCEEW